MFSQKELGTKIQVYLSTETTPIVISSFDWTIGHKIVLRISTIPIFVRNIRGKSYAKN